MTRVGRAIEKGETKGFMKVVADAETKQILGAAILGVGGDEAIHGILDMMNAGATYPVLQWAVPIHPTVSELIPTVLGDLKPSRTEAVRSFVQDPVRDDGAAMDRIDAMRVFIAALDEGSLAGAGRQLGRSPAAVSRAIAFLEQQVTAPLSAPKTAMAAKGRSCCKGLRHRPCSRRSDTIVKDGTCELFPKGGYLSITHLAGLLLLSSGCGAADGALR